jgi:hypothetical protein
MTEPGLATPATPPASNPGAQNHATHEAERHVTRWKQKLAEDTSTAAVDPAAAQTESDQPEADSPPALGSAILFLLGLLWLAATMWSARASIASNAADPAVVISTAALALPGVIAATLLAGAAAGLAATGRFVRRNDVLSPGRVPSTGRRAMLRRLAIGAAAGALMGLLTAGVIVFAFGANAAIGILATTVGVSGLIAGAAAALPPPPLAAGIAATLSVFVTGALLNLFQTPLKSLLGAGETIASQYDAADRFSMLAGLISGLAAGVVSYLFLRRRGRGERWPWFLLAGAMAGIMALLGELLTQLGGASLLGIVGGFSNADQAILDYLGGARIASALTVGFTGGISAMILIGRTMRRPDDEPA